MLVWTLKFKSTNTNDKNKIHLFLVRSRFYFIVEGGTYAFNAAAFKSILWFYLTIYLLVTQLENLNSVFKVVFREIIPFIVLKYFKNK